MVRVDVAKTLTAAEDLAESFADIIGDGLRSVILHGSLATGDFYPGRSDIDILVVIANSLTQTQVDALKDSVCHCDIGNATGIDLHVITGEVGDRRTSAPPLELYIGRHDQLSDVIEIERRVSGRQ